MSTQSLDVFNCPLDGIRLIEASAGTGKTWNIAALYVRLLIERPLTVEQILVVTFTKAATAELRERIRARLASLVRALAPMADADADGDPQGDEAMAIALADPMLAGLFAHVIGHRVASDEALHRLRLALQAFDQAAIHTIHGFCQRALGETPFAAGLPFSLELVADDSDVQYDLAVDFWRREVEPMAACHAGFAAWLVDRKLTPQALRVQLARCLKKPMAHLRWPELFGCPDDAPHPGTLADLYAQARQCWIDEGDSIRQAIAQAMPGLNRRTYSDSALAQARDAWDAYLRGGDANAPLRDKAALLGDARFKQGTKKDGEPPRHAFFTLADTLLAARDADAQQHARRWMALLQAWLAWAPAALHARKQQLRTVSFDDLLGNLQRALASHAWLADVLRERYPCALIDEFQDTDPLQFDIFDRIYGHAREDADGDTAGARGPLFLVGDPKQAIYSFRAADLHTYLAARDAADARYTLDVNQRSTAAVIAAGNRLFGGNPRAFVLPGLTYPPVRPGARARVPLEDAAMDARGREAGFHVWMLPDGEDRLSKEGAKDHAARATAAEIARLLMDAAHGRAMLGERPLAPGDIAVIVQTHAQGSLVKRVLAGHGIGSVELTQDSVFASGEAETLERVLQAIDAPGDVRLLRAALATEFFGLDAAALDRLRRIDAPDADAVGWIERLQRYRQLWLTRGFAAMWRTLLRELELGTRWMQGADGARRLTNYTHLAELIQARWVAQPGAEALLRWLASQRRHAATGGGGEEAQLRLESDQHLVQIVTVHKSKGLEYAVVFCPFIWDGRMREPEAIDGIEFHDAQCGGAAVIDYTLDGTDDDRRREAAQAAVRQEQAAEQVRLWYVALTRAVYRCYLVAGVYHARRSTREACAGMLNWLVAGASQSFDAWARGDTAPQAILDAWHSLDGDAIIVGALPEASGVPIRVPANAQAGGAPLAARDAARVTQEVWRIASFSGLVAAGAAHHARDDEAQAIVPARPDYDAVATAFDVPAWHAAVGIPALPADDILRFPRGPAAGECLHRAFELADFTDSASWPQAADRALRERPPEAASADSARWPAMIARMLADTLACEIQPDLRLCDVDAAQRLIELEFVYPVGSFALPALRALLREAGYPEPPLDNGVLRGYMKGFIDLVFCHGGRWWIVDWKSNHLGDTPRDYGAGPLADAMAQHGYHLQYLLYTVALHRYLRLRLADYDYERDIGGCLYLFVRGVRPDWRVDDQPAGVFADRPPRALIDALDRLMQPRADAGVRSVMESDA